MTRVNTMRHHQYGSETFLKSILLVVLLASSGVVSLAELPLYVYKVRQQQAPEALIIKVQSVKTRATDEPRLKRASHYQSFARAAYANRLIHIAGRPWDQP